MRPNCRAVVRDDLDAKPLPRLRRAPRSGPTDSRAASRLEAIAELLLDALRRAKVEDSETAAHAAHEASKAIEQATRAV
jgi:hypothetical protein